MQHQMLCMHLDRATRIFLSLIHKHCGKCETAIETTGKENEMLRKKLRRNPRLRYGNYDDIPDLTARSLRKKYRQQFDIDYVIYRHNKAKHMTWPNL
uniref:uncharacterized protein LOC120344620 isoform X2 n=1 Tax=Styela clava TaxID=7725 RepID=UPI00193AA4C0|nr:uncharacterized protein LOC120344620 isoform X2 [Styela clava]